MAKINEFDDLFGEPSAGETTAKEDGSVTLPGATPAEEAEFDDLFLSGGHAPYKEPESLITPESLSVLAGGAAGKIFGKPADLSGNGLVARTAEKAYGTPTGSLATAQDLAAPASADAISRRVAEQHLANPPGVAPNVEERPTPGGRWAEKTGYGAGEGSVEDVNTRYKRRAGHGKVISALEKKFGVAKPGENPHLIERMAERSAAAEAAVAAQAQIESQKIAAEAERMKAMEAHRSTLDKLAENIKRAGGASGMAQQALRTGLNVGSGMFGALHGFQGASDMQQQGLTGENAAQTVGGIGGMYAMRNPTVGLPVAGTAEMYRAGSDIYKHGPSLENTAQMASGVGLAAMPRSPIVGSALQIPGLSLAAVQYLKAHPELIPQWLKTSGKSTPPAP